jgi:hypothetical protein
MNVQAALKGQYHAAMAMLKDAVDQCPDDLWTGGNYPNAFWRVAYHTLFYTHMYLQPDIKSFKPWRYHRDGWHSLGKPRKPLKTVKPCTKARVLMYWRFCDKLVDSAVAKLDLDAPKCGFWWYKLPKLDHQINNIRHIQHHAALLAGRLRLAGGIDVGWVGGG